MCIPLQYLSARTCICGVPFPQLLTIHAASKAARKPRAIPVPKGQKGYTHQTPVYYKIKNVAVSTNTDLLTPANY